jgi:hypothetical protein
MDEALNSVLAGSGVVDEVISDQQVLVCEEDSEVIDIESQQISSIQLVPLTPSQDQITYGLTGLSPEDVVSRTEAHLNTAKTHLASLNANLVKQAAQMLLVVHEPELWHRSFPLLAYNNLLAAFQSVHRSGRAVNSGCRELSVIIAQMLERKEDVSCHLVLFTYMSEHLFQVTGRADEALQLAHDALKR